jgi:hypothetical protein
MICKYCKSQNHLIDTCQDIICRVCKQYGHPHWKCSTHNSTTTHNAASTTTTPNNKSGVHNTGQGQGQGQVKRSSQNRDRTKYNNRLSVKNVSPKMSNLENQSIADYYQYMDKPWSEIF